MGRKRRKLPKKRRRKRRKLPKKRRRKKRKLLKGRKKRKLPKRKKRRKLPKRRKRIKQGKRHPAARRQNLPDHQIKEMIMKALEGLDEKNGSSVVAIKNYIAENWPEKAESSQFSNSFKKALAALAEDSSIVRPKKQEGNPDGATGSYKINKEKSKEKEKEAKE